MYHGSLFFGNKKGKVALASSNIIPRQHVWWWCFRSKCTTYFSKGVSKVLEGCLDIPSSAISVECQGAMNSVFRVSDAASMY